MSTRGCVAVGTPEKWEGVYNHHDSYPDGLGKELYEHLERRMLEGKTLAEIGEDILKFDDWRNYISGGICEYCGRFAGQAHTISGIAFTAPRGVGEYPDPDAKHHQHNSLENVADTHITSEHADPLFMEWVYIIDPAANLVHVLRGQHCPMVPFDYDRNKGPQPLGDGRFHYGHCVFRHVSAGTLRFDQKPDWEALHATA